MGVAIWPIRLIGLNEFETILLQILIGIAVYMCESKLLNVDGYQYTISIIKHINSRNRFDG